MPDFQEALTRKFGPLPAWGWAGIAGGGIWWYRQHTAGGGSQGGVDASNPAYVGPYGELPAQIDGGAGFGGGSGGGGTDTSGGSGDTSGGGGTTAPPAPPVINVQAPPANAGQPRATKPKPAHARADKGPWKQSQGTGSVIRRAQAATHPQSSRKRSFGSTVTRVKPRKPPAKPTAKAKAKGRKVAKR